MHENFSGGCLCGALRVTISAPPKRTGLCHCLTCRKETGAPFKHFAVFNNSDVQITGDAKFWTSPEHTSRYFCPTCGSHVYEKMPLSAEMEISAGVLDEANHWSPTYEVWCIRRENWLPSLHLPQFPQDRDG